MTIWQRGCDAGPLLYIWDKRTIKTGVADHTFIIMMYYGSKERFFMVKINYIENKAI